MFRRASSTAISAVYESVGNVTFSSFFSQGFLTRRVVSHMTIFRTEHKSHTTTVERTAKVKISHDHI